LCGVWFVAADATLLGPTAPGEMSTCQDLPQILSTNFLFIREAASQALSALTGWAKIKVEFPYEADPSSSRVSQAMIHLDCACGSRMEVLDLYAGGHVVCHSCGASVLVPANAVALEEKFRFHCPHCEARVVGRRGSAGKKSQCPSCGKTYTVPEPPSDSDVLESHADRRIHLNTDDLAARIGLPFPVGRLEPRTPPRPQPRYLHPPEEVAAAREEPMPWPLASEMTPPTAEFQTALGQSTAPSPSRPGSADPRPTSEQWPGGKTLDQHLAEFMDPNRQMVVGSTSSIEPSSSAPTAASIPQFDGEAKPSSVGELRVVSGSCTGQRIRMDFRRFVVGNERDCDLRPTSTMLSRHHCVFKRDEYAVRVRDLGSNSGTYVNGRRIQTEAILKPGDDVTVGDVTLHVILPHSPRITQMHDSNPSISDFVIL
jgi:FHA domain